MKAVKLSEGSNRVLTTCQGQTIQSSDKAGTVLSYIHDVFYIKHNTLSDLATSMGSMGM